MILALEIAGVAERFRKALLAAMDHKNVTGESYNANEVLARECLAIRDEAIEQERRYWQEALDELRGKLQCSLTSPGSTPGSTPTSGTST